MFASSLLSLSTAFLFFAPAAFATPIMNVNTQIRELACFDLITAAYNQIQPYQSEFATGPSPTDATTMLNTISDIVGGVEAKLGDVAASQYGAITSIISNGPASVTEEDLAKALLNFWTLISEVIRPIYKAPAYEGCASDAVSVFDALDDMSAKIQSMLPGKLVVVDTTDLAPLTSCPCQAAN